MLPMLRLILKLQNKENSMKKTFKKSLILGLASLSLLSCQGNNEDKSNNTPLSPISESGLHLQKGTLHDVNVKESTRVFVDNGKSDYKIYYEGGNTLAQKAASFMASHIEMATGVLLEVKPTSETTTIEDKDHVILLGDKKLQEANQIPVSSKDIGTTGYQISTKNDSIFIRVGGDLGFQQAAIAFLKHALGFTRYSYNIVTYSKDGKTLPDMDIVERPDFDFRTQSNKVDASTAYEMGFLTLSEVFYADSETQHFHNSFDYLPVEEYKERHSKWYSDKGTQICYTAHGDKEEYDKMVDEVYKKMVTRLAKDKTVRAFTFSIQDNPDSCTCDACKANVVKYGADSSSVVKFCNSLDDKIQNYLQEQADKTGQPKRELNILFFAYHKTEKPCVKKNSKGEYEPTSPDIVCNPHVGPYIAPISACFTKSLYDEDNAIYADNIKGWGALSNKLYMWLYETNFSHYLYPLNTYSTMIESYRYCYENNGMYMFNEGQHNNGAVTCFGHFKEYFNSVALFDVNTDYNSIVDDFFSSYFREASVPMLKYFKELQEQFAYVQSAYSTDINGTIYNNIAQSRFWPKKLLDRWVGYINEGYEAILPYKTSNRILYEALYNNILLESIFPRFALLNHYSGKYSAETLQELRKTFRDDCYKVNVTMLNEGSLMDSVFSAWGI